MFLGLSFSNFIFRYLDKGSFETFGPLGFLRAFHYLGFRIESLSTGFIPHYAFIFIFSISLFLLF